MSDKNIKSNFLCNVVVSDSKGTIFLVHIFFLRLVRPLNISFFSKRSVCVPEMCKKETYLSLNGYRVVHN